MPFDTVCLSHTGRTRYILYYEKHRTLVFSQFCSYHFSAEKELLSPSLSLSLPPPSSGMHGHLHKAPVYIWSKTVISVACQWQNMLHHHHLSVAWIAEIKDCVLTWNLLKWWIPISRLFLSFQIILSICLNSLMSLSAENAPLFENLWFKSIFDVWALHHGNQKSTFTTD